MPEVTVDFEVAIALAISEIIKEKILDAEAGGGAGGINAICGRPEVTDDVFSSYYVQTFRDYHAVNLRVQ